MDGIVVNFGTVFRYREKEYVFLAQDEDTLYAAKIINASQTEELSTLSNRLEGSGSARSAMRRKNPVFAFVVLSTKDFYGQGAHLLNTGDVEHQSALSYFDKIGQLDRSDVVLIKNEILSDDSVVPLGLQNIIKELNLEE